MDLYGIAEPSSFPAVQHFEGTRSNTQVLRGEEDVIEHILGRHTQLGIDNVIYQCGRGFMSFHTDHPLLTVQGTVTKAEGLEDQLLEGSRIWFDYIQRTCPLRKALDVSAELGLRMWGWMCMNRNYAEQNGKMNCSRFWLANRDEMCEHTKTGRRDLSRLCYAHEEFRAERLAALLEPLKVAGPNSGRHLEGMVACFVRQPPMLRYHPRLCSAYEKQTGINPRTIEAQDCERFLAWCRWRCEILTDFMRTVRREVDALAESTGRPIKLVARITDLGPNVNLIEGVDIATWLKEGLVDAIVTSPLNWIRTVWEHDLTPYVRLAREGRIPVIAGVSLNQMTRFHRRRGSVNYAVLARRVHEYQRAGADGIAFYQSECGLEFDGMDELIPKFADPRTTAALLSDESFLAAWPVTHLNCAYGLDCHSWFNDYTIDEHRAEAGSAI